MHDEYFKSLNILKKYNLRRYSLKLLKMCHALRKWNCDCHIKNFPLSFFFKTTLINPAYTIFEIKKQIENADAQAIFTFPAKYADVNTSIENNSKIKLPIVIVNDGSGGTASIAKTIKFDDLIRDDIEEFSVGHKINVNYEDTVLLPYSSGTTGAPKNIETSHRCAQSDNVLNI